MSGHDLHQDTWRNLMIICAAMEEAHLFGSDSDDYDEATCLCSGQKLHMYDRMEQSLADYAEVVDTIGGPCDLWEAFQNMSTSPYDIMAGGMPGCLVGRCFTIVCGVR